MSDHRWIVRFPPWAQMWSLAMGIYSVCKIVTWPARSVEAPAWKHWAYLLVWPGMACDAFLQHREPNEEEPTATEWFFAFFKFGIGLLMLAVIVPLLETLGLIIQGWSGMIGIVFTLHFGLFHVLSCSWRRLGAGATPLMNWPIAAESLSEFWGRQWNLAFRDLTHRFLFSPLRRPLGPTAALLVGFFTSGLVHDLVISGPSGAGRGLPTLYFSIQGIGLVAERCRLATRLGLRQGLSGRLYCIALIALPSLLLFHTAFATNVLHPFHVAIGSAS